MTEHEQILQLRQRVLELERKAEEQHRHLVCIVRALKAHDADFHINLGTTTGSLK